MNVIGCLLRNIVARMLNQGTMLDPARVGIRVRSTYQYPTHIRTRTGTRTGTSTSFWFSSTHIVRSQFASSLCSRGCTSTRTKTPTTSTSTTIAGKTADCTRTVRGLHRFQRLSGKKCDTAR
eukprot:scaffold651954_cov38-Prasinocladus_malaysianus.AAC.1